MVTVKAVHGNIVEAHADTIVVLLEAMTGASMIEGTYFSVVPSEIEAGDLVVIALLSFTLCSAAVIRPTLLAAKANPAVELHSR